MPIAGYEVDGDGCWVYQGATNNRGYGTLYVDGHSRPAHRWYYEQERGEIPKGLQLDHLCRNRLCVNPDHLEPVTPKENHRRCKSGVLLTACPKGHEYTPENTRFYGRGEKRCRYCRACEREKQQRYRDREKAAA